MINILIVIIIIFIIVYYTYIKNKNIESFISSHHHKTNNNNNTSQNEKTHDNTIFDKKLSNIIKPIGAYNDTSYRALPQYLGNVATNTAIKECSDKSREKKI